MNINIDKLRKVTLMARNKNEKRLRKQIVKRYHLLLHEIQKKAEHGSAYFYCVIQHDIYTNNVAARLFAIKNTDFKTHISVRDFTNVEQIQIEISWE